MLVQAALATALERSRRVKPRHEDRSAAEQDARQADSLTTSLASTPTSAAPLSRVGRERKCAAAAASSGGGIGDGGGFAVSAIAFAGGGSGGGGGGATASSSPASASSDSPASAGAGAAGGDQFEAGGDARDTDEAAAICQLMAAFPRGRLREGSTLAPDAAVIRESWTLLVKALEAKSREALSSEAGNGTACAVDPNEFPLILSERVHADVVRGLAANLMEVEVRPMLRKRCTKSICSPTVEELCILP